MATRKAALARRLDGVEVAARKRAAAIVAESEAQAGATIHKAEVEASRVREAAYRDTAEAIAAERTRLGAEAALERQRWLVQAEPQVARLALEIAHRVVGAAAERDCSVAVESAARALSEARERTRVVLRVNPADLPSVAAAEARLAALVPGASPLRLREDETVGRGGAVVETEAGCVEATLDAQLAAIARALGVEP